MKKMALLTVMALCLGFSTLVGCGKSEEKTAETTPAPQSATTPAPEVQAQVATPAAETPEEIAAKAAAEMQAQEEATRPSALGAAPGENPADAGVTVEKIEDAGNQAMQEAAAKAREMGAAAVQQAMEQVPGGPEAVPPPQELQDTMRGNAAENLPKVPVLK